MAGWLAMEALTRVLLLTCIAMEAKLQPVM